MIYPDKSISDIKLSLNFASKMLDTLKHKSVDNPFDQNDYHELYKAIDIVESVTYCRWIKEYY